MEFNGWKNWQTQNTALWLGHHDEDRATYNCLNIAKLKETFQDYIGKQTPDMDAEGEMYWVDWDEIFENI